MGCPFSTSSAKVPPQCGELRIKNQSYLLTDSTAAGGVSVSNMTGAPNAAVSGSTTPPTAGNPIVPRHHTPQAVDAAIEEVRRNYLAGTLKVDPRCPINDRQLYGLTKTWKAINRNMTVTAMNMFVRYVGRYTDRSPTLRSTTGRAITLFTRNSFSTFGSSSA
jgi:hypothetical protein